MSVSDDIFDLGVAMMRAQADAMQMGDEQGRHARALRKLIADCEGLADYASLIGEHVIALDLRAAIQEAREAVDG